MSPIFASGASWSIWGGTYRAASSGSSGTALRSTAAGWCSSSWRWRRRDVLGSSHGPVMLPAEPHRGVWDHLKDNDWATVSCLDRRELRGELRAAKQRLQRHPEGVRSFFREAEYG